MLLRLRSPSGETLKLHVEPCATFAQLLEIAAEAAGLELSVCTLSLNKATPLAPDEATPLTQLGLASGDLLYITSPAAPSGTLSELSPRARVDPLGPPSGGHRGLAPTAAPRQATVVSASPVAPYQNPLRAATPSPQPSAAAAAAAAAAVARSDRSRGEQRLIEMGFIGESISNALDATEGDIDAAAALLAENAQADAAHRSSVPDQNPTPMQDVISTMSERDAAARAAAAAVGAAALSTKAPVPTAALPRGALVPDALVSSILGIMHAAEPSGQGSALVPHEAVILAAHALLVSAGFVPLTQGSTRPLGDTAGVAAGLPEDWRARGGMVAIAYGHVRRGDVVAPIRASQSTDLDATLSTSGIEAGSAVPLVELRAVVMGRTVLLHAMVAGACASQLLSAQVDSSILCGGDATASAALPRPEDLRRLLHRLGVDLLQPLLALMRTKVFDPDGVGQPPGLMDLQPELRLAVLAFLPPTALAAAASVCRTMRTLAMDDTLWRALYIASFGEEPPDESLSVPSASTSGPSKAPSNSVRLAFRDRLVEERRRAAEAERRRRDGPMLGGRPFVPRYDPYHDPDDDFGVGGGLGDLGGYGPAGPQYPGGLPVPVPGFIGGNHDRLPGFGPGPSLPGYPGFDPPMGLQPGHPGRLGGGRGTGFPRFDPYDPLVDPDGTSGFGGGGPLGIPGRGGRGGRGFGRGNGRGPGGRFDPDGPGFDTRFL